MKKNWRYGQLGQFFETVTGSTPPKNKKQYYGNDVPFVKPPELQNGPLDSAEDGLSKEGATVARVLPPKSILVSCIGNLCKIGMNTIPVAFNQQINAIKPDYDKAIPEFIYYLTLSPAFSEQLHRLASGTTVPIVNKSKFNSIQIPLPPLPEQKRIVAILDEAFAGIDAVVANTRQNLANARELFESYLNAVFSRKGEGWEEKRLDELCTFSSGGTPSKGNSSYWLGEIPWVSGRDMKSTRLSDSALHISQSAVEGSATRMASVGTLLILVRGMGLAHGAQIAELLAPCAFNQDIRGIHAKPELLPRYLLFALRDRINTSDTVMSNAAHGTLKIDSNELQKVVIPFPPLDHQVKIVSTIDALTDETQRLESIYQQKLAALAELKQSILQKAFAGELTALLETTIEEAVA